MHTCALLDPASMPCDGYHFPHPTLMLSAGCTARATRNADPTTRIAHQALGPCVYVVIRSRHRALSTCFRADLKRNVKVVVMLKESVVCLCVASTLRSFMRLFADHLA